MREQHRGLDLASSIMDDHTLADRDRVTSDRDPETDGGGLGVLGLLSTDAPARRRIGSSATNDTSADGSRRPARLSGRERGFAGGISDELAALRGKNRGACAACGRAVFFAQDFTRSRGRVAHVRCPITARTPSPMPPAVPAQSVARVRSEPA